ncbi:MAG TPA: hypothetical protein PKA98_14070, partial [Acidimicrobiales bacterium]|nr:hypothetical protein [Acidimicrobiales bacterium]
MSLSSFFGSRGDPGRNGDGGGGTAVEAPAPPAANVQGDPNGYGAPSAYGQPDHYAAPAGYAEPNGHGSPTGYGEPAAAPGGYDALPPLSPEPAAPSYAAPPPAPAARPPRWSRRGRR